MDEKYKNDTASNNTDTSTESDNEESESEDSIDALDINPTSFFSIKELCYYKLINKFFSGCSHENITQMIDIVEGKSDMSLRVLDWFVTKYSKKRIDCCQTKYDDVFFDVRISYKSQLKSYKKKYFDPFRRKKKFNYYFPNNQSMKTTLGQLNFFKWAFSCNIIYYVEKNLKHIIKEMKLSNKELDKKNKSKKNKKKKKNNSENEKTTKIKKTKKNIDSDNLSGNIKINSSKSNKDDEIKLTLVFD